MKIKSDADKAKVAKQGGWGEVGTIFLHALIIAFFVRVFFYQPFNIPSGSMQSTLLIGDYLFVSKLSYGYSRYTFPFGLNLFSGRIFASEPKRGDVVVFKLPRDNSTDYIKRVIGLPGEEIVIRGGVVFINGKEVPRRPVAPFVQVDEDGRKRSTPQFEETLPNGVKFLVVDQRPDGDYDNVGPYKVPPGHYFMMGDNRDNSTDSRVPPHRYGVGYVPFENLVGRADIIFFSAAVDEPGRFQLLTPWTWPFDVRWSRIFSVVR
ncbi:MAG: signal peptidase I [Hyphomicrobiaceae bacterium]|nr:signal peptidase I [Hyphomicrobiaceae bacterium]